MYWAAAVEALVLPSNWRRLFCHFLLAIRQPELAIDFHLPFAVLKPKPFLYLAGFVADEHTCSILKGLSVAKKALLVS